MHIINVMASSIDGRIGLHDQEGDRERQNLGLTGEADQDFLRQEMAACDAIIVGASSIRANGECLVHPGRSGQPPAWFIFAQHTLPAQINFWQQSNIPRFLVSPKPLAMPESTDVINLVYGEANPALFVAQELQKQSHQHCLLFGGGHINSWFYQLQLVDELRLTIAPLLLGQATAPYLVEPKLALPVKLVLTASLCSESFVFLTYKVLKK